MSNQTYTVVFPDTNSLYDFIMQITQTGNQVNLQAADADITVNMTNTSPAVKMPRLWERYQTNKAIRADLASFLRQPVEDSE